MFQSVFIYTCCLRSTVANSALGITHFRGHLCVCFRCGLMTRCYPKGNLVGGLRHLGFSPCRHPSYRALTFPLAGLSPAEQRQPLLDAQLHVNVSAHAAPIIQPAIQDLTSSEQIILVRVSSHAPTNALLSFCGPVIF